MKTFADVKRKMRPGTKWRCIWLFWPKAKDIQVIDENTFIVINNGRPMLKYIFVE